MNVSFNLRQQFGARQILRLSALMFLLLVGADAGYAQLRYEPIDDSVKGTRSANLVLRVERFHSCKICPAYELLFFSDGEHYFIGKDSVRRLGKAGSRLNRDIEEQAVAAINSAGSARATLSVNNRQVQKAHIASLLRSLEDMVVSQGSLATLAKLEAVDMPSRDRTWRTEIEFFLEDGISRKVAFYDGEATTSSLAYAAKSAEQLHQSTGDFAPLPSVRDDGALVLRWSQLWPDYTRSACPGVRAEIIAYLYRNGRLEIHSQARRVFLSRVNEIESGGEKYPLDVPVYSRTVSRLSNAEMEALLKSMKHDLATLQAEMKERNRIAERTLISTRHYELPQLDFVLRSENELVFFGQAPRQGPSNALEKELDRLVVQIRRLASAELGHRVFRCEQSAISY